MSSKPVYIPYAGPVLLQIERRFKEIYEQDAKPQAAMEVPVEVYA